MQAGRGIPKKGVVERTEHRFGFRDLAEIFVGATVLGFPIAVTEEVWIISEELTPGRQIFVVLLSILVLAWFGYMTFYKNRLKRHWREFVLRIVTVYGITLFDIGLILAAVDRLGLAADPVVALKRVILVAFPASFSATVVDSLR
ncbi:MAG: DUF2391 family protein [Candidatus Latescibacterota bacterium]|nr:MAG: DUF2391 family protein [Candidatus Latescibacterota bacterium]